MSKGWAGIVYGRSYHLDFRFITLPHDFTASDISWVSQHIIATTQQARNLANSPRWSLFKNNDYCVVGVTCMVRDLIDMMTKDDRGRPLYVFVGYVTQLERHRKLENFPSYRGECIDRFKSLYREIEKVWSIKDYERGSRSPFSSQYEPLKFDAEATSATSSHQIPQINDRLKYPDRTYLWPSQTQPNKLLWLASAGCIQSTSICLNIQGKPLVNSPFLNQTLAHLDGFQIAERIVASREHSSLSTTENSAPLADSSLSRKISLRAKEDIDLTLQQAAKVATASQELLDNFTNWSNSSETASEQLDAQTDTDEADSFGFKTKKSSSNQQDWF